MTGDLIKALIDQIAHKKPVASTTVQLTVAARHHCKALPLTTR